MVGSLLSRGHRPKAMAPASRPWRQAKPTDRTGTLGFLRHLLLTLDFIPKKKTPDFGTKDVYMQHGRGAVATHTDTRTD